MSAKNFQRNVFHEKDTSVYIRHTIAVTIDCTSSLASINNFLIVYLNKLKTVNNCDAQGNLKDKVPRITIFEYLYI